MIECAEPSSSMADSVSNHSHSTNEGSVDARVISPNSGTTTASVQSSRFKLTDEFGTQAVCPKSRTSTTSTLSGRSKSPEFDFAHVISPKSCDSETSTKNGDRHMIKQKFHVLTSSSAILKHSKLAEESGAHATAPKSYEVATSSLGDGHLILASSYAGSKEFDFIRDPRKKAFFANSAFISPQPWSPSSLSNVGGRQKHQVKFEEDNELGNQDRYW